MFRRTPEGYNNQTFTVLQFQQIKYIYLKQIRNPKRAKTSLMYTRPET